MSRQTIVAVALTCCAAMAAWTIAMAMTNQAELVRTIIAASR